MALWLWLVGCGSTPVDERIVEDTGPCGQAPVLTWDNFGRGFVIENCQACHASTAPERQGAPEGVVFDTEEDAWRWSERILVRAARDADMPPQGGVDADDRRRLELWLGCGG